MLFTNFPLFSPILSLSWLVPSFDSPFPPWRFEVSDNKTDKAAYQITHLQLFLIAILSIHLSIQHEFHPFKRDFNVFRQETWFVNLMVGYHLLISALSVIMYLENRSCGDVRELDGVLSSVHFLTTGTPTGNVLLKINW